jgi:hypothetical protein
MQPKDIIPTFRLGGSPVGNLASGTLDQLSSNPGTRALGISKIKNVGWQLIPGGSQIKKTLQGSAQAKKTGQSELRGAIFGKGSLNKISGSHNGPLTGSGLGGQSLKLPSLKIR